MAMHRTFGLLAFAAALVATAAPLTAQDDDVLPKKGAQLALEEPRQKVMRDKLIGWLNEHTTVKGLPDSIDKALDEMSKDTNTFRCAFGAELTDTDTPYLVDVWDNRLYFHALSPKQATKIGLKPRSLITYAKTAKQQARRLATALVRIEELKITGGNSVDNATLIKGRVNVKSNNAANARLGARITYRLGSVMFTRYQPINPAPEAGDAVAFSFGPIYRSDVKDIPPYTGPLPVYVDLVVETKKDNDYETTIYSNTLTVLLDVTSNDE